MSYRSSPDKTKKTLQNKVLDGGIAGDSSIIILPKNTTSGLDEITSEVGLLAYDTTQNEIVVDKGSGWEVVGGGGGDGGVLTVDPVGSSPNANGATISGTALILQMQCAVNF